MAALTLDFAETLEAIRAFIGEWVRIDIAGTLGEPSALWLIGKLVLDDYERALKQLDDEDAIFLFGLEQPCDGPLRIGDVSLVVARADFERGELVPAIDTLRVYQRSISFVLHRHREESPGDRAARVARLLELEGRGEL